MYFNGAIIGSYHIPLASLLWLLLQPSLLLPALFTQFPSQCIQLLLILPLSLHQRRCKLMAKSSLYVLNVVQHREARWGMMPTLRRPTYLKSMAISPTVNTHNMDSYILHLKCNKCKKVSKQPIEQHTWSVKCFFSSNPQLATYNVTCFTEDNTNDDFWSCSSLHTC